jgi:hypothetical protein
VLPESGIGEYGGHPNERRHLLETMASVGGLDDNTNSHSSTRERRGEMGERSWCWCWTIRLRSPACRGRRIGATKESRSWESPIWGGRADEAECEWETRSGRWRGRGRGVGVAVYGHMAIQATTRLT